MKNLRKKFQDSKEANLLKKLDLMLNKEKRRIKAIKIRIESRLKNFL